MSDMLITYHETSALATCNKSGIMLTTISIVSSITQNNKND